MSRLTRDGTAEPVSRDQILRHARGQGNVHFPCSADHEQDWQPYPVDPYSAICDDHTYIHTYIQDRKAPLFRPGKGHKSLMYCSTLDSLCILEERLKSSPLSQLGWLVKGYSGTIGTYMALRAGMIGQQRHSTSS